jgi:hypothetical protein
MYTLNGSNLSVKINESKATFAIMVQGHVYTMNGRPYVALNDGRFLYADESSVKAVEVKTGTYKGVSLEYAIGEDLTLHALIYIDDRDDLYFVTRIEGDTASRISHVSFPSAVDFNGTEAGRGYTVLPRMHGTLVPSGTRARIVDGLTFGRDAYIPLFGQVRDGSGYVCIFDTPYDARYELDDENVVPIFIPSMAKMSYPRSLLYKFFDSCDYNDFARYYRKYLEERGQILTLDQKCIINPTVKEIIGVPIVHIDPVCMHIHPESLYHDNNDKSKNDLVRGFDWAEDILLGLNKAGLDKAYVHLDGWGVGGYDSHHPEPFPPSPEAGGAEAMKRVSETADKLGYVFAVHDQYRDYYYNCKSFDFKNATMKADGSYPYCADWFGGPQTFLCASLAPSYVNKNYNEFERLGIKLKGAYLDVFSVVELDECFDPNHPMTREKCADHRGRCFSILTSRGLVPSSEEPVGWSMKYISLCHHAPFFTSNLGSSEADPVGVPIPLFNLVYHDCIVIPWIGVKGQRGGWGIPGNDYARLYAVLNGNPIYCPVDADPGTVKDVKEICALAGKLANKQMLRHEFSDTSMRRQKTYWSDGTIIEIDPENESFKVLKH